MRARPRVRIFRAIYGGIFHAIIWLNRTNPAERNFDLI